MRTPEEIQEEMNSFVEKYSSVFSHWKALQEEYVASLNADNRDDTELLFPNEPAPKWLH